MKDRDSLDRIILYCQKINRYIGSINSVVILEQNEMNLDAIIMNLKQIGETAKKLSEAAKEKYFDIDWQKIIGLRNMISHEYEGINITIIYSIATIHVPKLLDSLVNGRYE